MPIAKFRGPPTPLTRGTNLLFRVIGPGAIVDLIGEFLKMTAFGPIYSPWRGCFGLYCDANEVTPSEPRES